MKEQFEINKVRNNLIFIFMILVVLLSCGKEEDYTPYPVIKPLEYFPVYPGSWWRYVDSNNDTTTIKTAPEYQLDAYKITSAAFESDSFYVPVYDGTPIWQYHAHVGPISHSGSTPLRRILYDTTAIGYNWSVYNWGGTAKRRKLVARDTSISISSTIYHPTILIEEYYTQGPPNYYPGYIWVARRYYTKDIGLIKEDLYDYQNDSVTTKEIIDFHINQ
ncbi:hypothetical protein [Halocola ammonii]